MQHDTDGVPSPLERLRKEMERPPFNSWLSPVAVAADEARREVTMSLAYRPEFSYHPTEAIFHGGVLAALIDIAGYAAIAVWHGRPTPTIGLQVEYLAPARGGTVEARGMLRRLGRSIGRADIELTCGGKLVALGRGTFSTGGQ